MNIFRKQKKFTYIQEFCPLLALWPDDKTTVSKGGQFSRVVELTGKSYTGLSPEVTESLYRGRKGFFEGLPSGITVMHQSHRQRLAKKGQHQRYNIRYSGLIASKWAENFNETYRTRHFLIFVTDHDISDQLQLLVKKRDKEETRTDELLRELNDCVKDAMVRLHEYGPQELEGDELVSYWGWLLNGRYVKQIKPENGLLDDILSGVAVRWPAMKKHQVYDGNDTRYSAWFHIKAPATTTSHALLESLFKCSYEFAVFQTMSTFEKSSALAFIEDKRKSVMTFARSPEIILTELNELSQRVQADNVAMIRHRWALEVFGNTVEELERAANEVRNVVESHGYRLARETVNQEALYWSRFPEFQGYNCRQRFMTSENAPHFATMSTAGEGFDRCSWGPWPVTQFKTETGSEFSFIFHQGPEKTVLGNTLVIGGTGSGKTTLISFMLSQCFRFKGFKALAFDRLRGMEIFTKFHDGDYENFDAGIEINPLQLDDTTENRAFLHQWFQVLTGKTEDKAGDVIGQAIIQAFELERRERSLVNIADAFGLANEGSVRKSLAKWLPGGAFEGFFNGNRDALDFENPLVVFNMTSLLETPDVLGPMAYYLFHKLFLKARDDGGYAVFVDELGKYLRSELFAPKIDMMLEEIRKTDGIFIGAIQEAGTVLDHKIAPKIKNNIATFILFPEPRADRRHYVEQLGLNENEFDWITSPHPRQVLVKRKEGESVILNVDLSPLGNYLKIFDSSANSVTRMNTLRSETSAWQKAYLNGLDLSCNG